MAMRETFPTWDSLIEHEMVLHFAIGLGADAHGLMDLAYTRLIDQSLQETAMSNFLLRHCSSFMKSLLEKVSEVTGSQIADPFKNKYFTYISQQETTIYTPGRFYVFSKDMTSSTAHCKVTGSSYKRFPALCVIQEVDRNLMRILQNIQRYQPVYILYGKADGLHSWHLNKTLKQMLDVAKTPIYKQIAQQMYGRRSEELEMSETTRTPIDFSAANIYSAILNGELPNLFLVDILSETVSGTDSSTFHLLDDLQLNHVRLTKGDMNILCEAVHSGTLPHLKRLNLSRNILTDCLEDLLGGADNPGLISLKTLEMRETELSATDLNSLAQALANNKLPALRELDVSTNKLTNCLKGLLSSIGQHLECLILQGGQLSSDDVKSFCAAVSEQKFMNLKKLELDYNTLTGCMEKLLGPSDKCVLPCLFTLDMVKTKLSRTDVGSLSQAIKCGRLPELQRLHLDTNNFDTMEDEVENLIRICVQHHKQELYIHLDRNNLTDVFLKRIESFCCGSRIGLGTTEWV